MFNYYRYHPNNCTSMIYYFGSFVTSLSLIFASLFEIIFSETPEFWEVNCVFLASKLGSFSVATSWDIWKQIVSSWGNISSLYTLSFIILNITVFPLYFSICVCSRISRILLSIILYPLIIYLYMNLVNHRDHFSFSLNQDASFALLFKKLILTAQRVLPLLITLDCVIYHYNLVGCDMYNNMGFNCVTLWIMIILIYKYLIYS